MNVKAIAAAVAALCLPLCLPWASSHAADPAAVWAVLTETTRLPGWYGDGRIEGKVGGAVSLMGGGSQPSRVADCVFIGGQGQLSMRGAGGEVVGNRFVNRQNVVNHYSLSAGGGTRIHGNRFAPEQGSGILIFRESDVEVRL